MGHLIAIEGIDGAGKTTLANSLASFFSSLGIPYVLSHEPTRGPWGKKIRDSFVTGRMSPEDEFQAFVEDRREHVRDVIRPALESGKVVILDRYFYSTIAYQSVRGLPYDWLVAKMKDEGFPVPDLVLLMDMAAEIAVKFVTGRGVANTFETLDNLTKCREVFLRLAETSSNFVVVDAARSLRGS